MLTIAGRDIGRGAPLYVIAEVGVNHDGDVRRAHQLVDVAADAGADAVKFQTFSASGVVAVRADAAPYQRRRGATGQHALLDALTLPDDAWEELADHATQRGLHFLSTAFDRHSLELLLDLGVPALKVPSGELDNLAFLEEMAGHGLPLLVSTGLGTQDEVRAAVAAASEAPALCLLHCVTAYPARAADSNLLAMRTMGEEFGVEVGWSDHTVGPVTATVAVALGACVLEKHLTWDRAASGPDHAASEDPEGFRHYVTAVRQAAAALGDGVKRPADSELPNLPHVRRSWHAARPLAAGQVLERGDVALVRPRGGLAPADIPVGRRLARPIAAGSPLLPEDFG